MSVICVYACSCVFICVCVCVCLQDDEYTHLYTLIVRSDNTYAVKIDNKEVEKGSLEEDWDFLPPKTIPDPEAKKQMAVGRVIPVCATTVRLHLKLQE